MFIGGGVRRCAGLTWGVEDDFELSRDVRVMRRASCAVKGGCRVAKRVTPASCVVATLTGGQRPGSCLEGGMDDSK